MKALILGSGAALVLGLATGTAMRPVLAVGDLIPEMQPVTPGFEPDAWASGVSYAAYHGKIPDYVIGTDWLYPPQPPQLFVAEPAMADTGESVDVDTAEIAYHPPYDPPPAQPPHYPSSEGDILASAPADEAQDPAASAQPAA